MQVCVAGKCVVETAMLWMIVLSWCHPVAHEQPGRAASLHSVSEQKKFGPVVLRAGAAVVTCLGDSAAGIDWH